MDSARVRCRRSSNHRTMADLPADIIFDILSLLPVRSLCRFRRVSKQFFSLITNPNFIKQHLNCNKNHKQQNKEQIILTGISLAGLCTLVIDPFEPSSCDLTSLQLNLSHPQKPRCIWASCDGLILISDCNGYSMFLVNPSTRDMLKVPQSPFTVSEKSMSTYALGYDSSTEDYVIVRISQQKPRLVIDKNGTDKWYFLVNVLSLYSLRKNFWKKISDCPYKYSWKHISDCPYKYFQYQDGIFFKGAFHWLAQGTIASLHVASESFLDVPLPSLECVHIDSLSVSKGCLCGSAYHWEHFEFWVMKEYGVRDSWTKFRIEYSGVRPLCFLSTGKMLMLSGMGSGLSIYDTKSGTCEKLQIQVLPYIFSLFTYVDSLVQLPQHNQKGN